MAEGGNHRQMMAKVQASVWPLRNFGPQCSGALRLEGFVLRLQGFVMRDSEKGFYSEAHSPTHFWFSSIFQASETSVYRGLAPSVCQARRREACH